MIKVTAHECVADFHRLSSQLGKQPTRDEYLKLGLFSRKKIDAIFGSWINFVRAAGAEPSKKARASTDPEKKYLREVETYGMRESIATKYSKEILPYHGKFERLKKDVFLVASISDSHSQFWDKFTWDVFLDFCKQSQPELIILGGDNLEFYRISRHNQNPQRALSLQSEIDFVVENKLKPLRAACPRAQIDYHMGNHEARLFSYLCEKAPALASLRNLQFDKLLPLNDLEINLVARDSFVFQTKMEDSFKVYRGKWAWTHGTDCTQFPALKEMSRHGVSGASGHVHRHTAYAKRDVYGFKTWMTLGASCTLKTGQEYIHSLINWETGFLLTFVHTDGVNQQHISTEGGFACVGGTVYKLSDKA